MKQALPHHSKSALQMRSKTFTLIFIISLFAQASLFAANCNIEFIAYPTSNDGEVQFDATVLEGEAPYVFTWNFGDDSFGNNESISHIYANAGVYEVCLSILDNGACSVSICESIFVPSYPTESICYDNPDCVLPGDTDNDYDANIFDLLNIGVHYEKTGFNRNNPSIEWEGQAAMDWDDNTFAGTNLKHSDCNGDGVISDMDVDAIDYNYRILHENVSSSNGNPLNPTVRLEFDQDTITLNETNPGLINTSLNIYFGDENTSMQNFYGFAMVLNYIEDFIQPSSVEVIFDENGLLGNTSETLQLDKPSKPKYIDLGKVRKTGTTVNGYGRVAKINFTLIGHLVVGRVASQATETKFQTGIREWKIIDQNGQPIDVNIQNDELAFKITTGTDDIPEGDFINISPNPSNGNFRINYNGAEVERIDVYSMDGKNIQSIESPDNTQTDINLNENNNGIYFIKLSTPYGSITRRVMIHK